MAEIKMPPFTKGKRQLENLEVDWSRELSLVRIHVEQVIGVIKQKFTILQNISPVKYCDKSTCGDSDLTKIVSVCCSLVNLCPSVVPQD